MYFSGPQIKAFVDALSKAYAPEKFDQLLLGRLDKSRQHISLGNNFIEILYAVVDLANNEGWVLELLSASRASNPRNPQLMKFEELLELGVIPTNEQPSFEKIVNERSTFSDMVDFRETLGSLETWVCAFDIPGGGGTGYLVQKDVVLTNYHVVEKLINGDVSPANVRCRFDYKAMQSAEFINPGTAIGLASEWDIAHSRYSRADTEADNDNWGNNELDYALIRLDQPVGKQSIGTNAEPTAPERGWQALARTPPALVKGDVIFILQHPMDLNADTSKLQPMQLSVGTVMGFAGNGLRVHHNSRTLPGSSGSPIFNANLEFVALHHAGEPNNRLDYRGAYNQAIPLPEIVRHLSETDRQELIVS